MFNLFNLFSLLGWAAFVFCAAAKGSAATLHNTALHCTTLSTYFTLYSFLGFIPFRALLLTSPSTSTSTSLLSASPQRGSCGMLGICFALCITFCSYATPLRLPHSDPPRAASFSFPLPFPLLSLPLFFWM